MMRSEQLLAVYLVAVAAALACSYHHSSVYDGAFTQAHVSFFIEPPGKAFPPSSSALQSGSTCWLFGSISSRAMSVSGAEGLRLRVKPAFEQAVERWNCGVGCSVNIPG